MEERFLDDQGSLQNSPVDVYMFFSISRPRCVGISNAWATTLKEPKDLWGGSG
jgi:hypothetical protein